MVLELGISDKIKQLQREGLRPSDKLIATIARAESAAFAPLLELATNVELLHKGEPECYAPIHALRLLGEVGAVEMIEPLFRQLPIELDYEDEELPQKWVEELPQIMARLGGPAVEPLWQIADDANWILAARSSALIALTYVTTADSTTHDAIAAGLRERLAATEDRELASHLVIALANLGLKDAYAEIMPLYRAGKIDQNIIPAGAARQLLLSDSSKRLGCVNHTIAERYELHGLSAEQEQGL